jgi:hypothetical protein
LPAYTKRNHNQNKQRPTGLSPQTAAQALEKIQSHVQSCAGYLKAEYSK